MAPPGANVSMLLGIESCEYDSYHPFIQTLQKAFPGKIQVRKFEGRRLTLDEMRSPGFTWPKEEEMYYILTANTKGAILAREAKADWLVTVADNLFPVRDWNYRLTPFLDTFRNQEIALAYSCQACRKLLAHAIFTPAWLEWNGGFIQYPGYYHSHGDAENYLKSLLGNRLVVLPSSLDPTHNHAIFGTATADNTFWMSNDKWTQSQSQPIFDRRRAEILAHHGLRSL
jgi:hypothetical protein